MGLFARTKSVVIVALLIALITAGIFGFLTERIIRLNRSTGGLVQSLEQEGQRYEQLKSLQQVLTELETEGAALQSRFLDTEGVVPFLKLLEDVGRDVGVTVEVASVGIQPDADITRNYEWLRVALRCEGSWAELFHFVVMLETIPYAVKLDQVGLLQPSGEGQKPWQGVFVLRAAKLKTL